MVQHSGKSFFSATVQPVFSAQVARTAINVGLVAGLLSIAVSASASPTQIRQCEQRPTQGHPWIGASEAAPALAAARSVLLSAYTHGLDPADYHADQLDARAEQLLARLAQTQNQEATTPLATEIAAFNQDMTTRVTCFLSHAKLGALDPRKIHDDIDIPARQWNARTELNQAWQAESVIDLLETAYPANEQYQALRIALAKYRTLADQERSTSLRPIEAATLEPGMRAMAVNDLRDRLVFLGDLDRHDFLEASRLDSFVSEENIAADAAAPILAPLYDLFTVRAVKRFQTRHGLVADGIVGRKTIAALNTPLFERVAQLELSMERLRWLPDMGDARVIRVNLPEFRLTSNGQSDAEPLDARVVIGRSGKSPTPIYVGQIKRLEVSPYWYVPASIAKEEILPRLRQNPNRLRRMDMEITTGGGRVYRDATPALLDLLASGAAKLRQRPGAKNALGRFKFVLPNARGIYLHDTSAKRLFGRTQRDFSHGCVRVEDPMALARLILQDSPHWTEERLQAAAIAEKPSYAKPTRPVMVVFSYETVRIADNGQIKFLPDVYDYNPRTIASVQRWASMNSENVNATARNSAEGQKLAQLSIESF